jgi:hypothetical protein
MLMNSVNLAELSYMNEAYSPTQLYPTSTGRLIVASKCSDLISGMVCLEMKVLGIYKYVYNRYVHLETFLTSALHNRGGIMILASSKRADSIELFKYTY